MALGSQIELLKIKNKELIDQQASIENDLNQAQQNIKDLDEVIWSLKRETAIAKLDTKNQHIENEIHMKKLCSISLENNENEMQEKDDSGVIYHVNNNENNNNNNEDKIEIKNLKSMNSLEIEEASPRSKAFFSIDPFEYIHKMGLSLCDTCIHQIKLADASNRNINYIPKPRNSLRMKKINKMEMNNNSNLKRKSEIEKQIHDHKFSASHRLTFISKSTNKYKPTEYGSVKEIDHILDQIQCDIDSQDESQESNSVISLGIRLDEKLEQVENKNNESGEFQNTDSDDDDSESEGIYEDD